MLKVNLPLYKINKNIILKEINLDLKSGENLTILGSNGAGKSTFAKLLCALIKSKKVVSIDGNYIEDIDSKKRAELINYIPPKLSIYDEYISVEDFLALNEYKQTPKAKKITQTLKLVGLEKHQKRFCSSLSSGESQLLLLSSALIQDAKLTIFDEPTSNLDPIKTKLIFSILKEKMQQNQKVVITHDLQLALKLDFRILYIDEGKGIHFKSTKEFFEPSNLEHIFKGSVVRVLDDVVVKM